MWAARISEADYSEAYLLHSRTRLVQPVQVGIPLGTWWVEEGELLGSVYDDYDGGFPG